MYATGNFVKVEAKLKKKYFQTKPPKNKSSQLTWVTQGRILDSGQLLEFHGPSVIRKSTAYSQQGGADLTRLFWF